MKPGWQSGTEIGILPGIIQVHYTSPKIQVLKNRNPDVTRQIDEWCRITGRSIHDLAMADHAFIIRNNSPNTYDVEFIKCRNLEPVLEWCTLQWGEPGPDGVWDIAHVAKYSPYLFIRGEENITLFRIVWE